MGKHRIQEGVNIRVVSPDSPHHMRTGRVDCLVSYIASKDGPLSGRPENRGWRVIFDWPLGGMASQAVLREHELEEDSC